MHSWRDSREERRETRPSSTSEGPDEEFRRDPGLVQVERQLKDPAVHPPVKRKASPRNDVEDGGAAQDRPEGPVTPGGRTLIDMLDRKDPAVQELRQDPTGHGGMAREVVQVDAPEFPVRRRREPDGAAGLFSGGPDPGHGDAPGDAGGQALDRSLVRRPGQEERDLAQLTTRIECTWPAVQPVGPVRWGKIIFTLPLSPSSSPARYRAPAQHGSGAPCTRDKWPARPGRAGGRIRG